MTSSRWTVVVTLALALTACGDDDGSPDDGGFDATPDAPPECTSDEACDDGLFCNGVEACVDGMCTAGAAIACDDDVACTIDVCDEDTDRCVFAAPDADGDGVRDAACVDAEGVPLGADCDDADPNRFPGNPEVCDADDRDEDCNLETFGAIDRDGDGYFDARCCNPTEDGSGQTCGLDCDDVRPNVNPAATEACDRVDNDCNGSIDEGVLVSGFADADRDGYGDFSMPLDSCAGLAGFVPAGGDEDCDDADRTRNPGQVEICDSVDNDCDDTVDESPQVVDWFRDVDGDGFGSAASGVVRSCTPVAGHALFGTDCNDAVAGVNPAAAEVCNGLDDDCVNGADFEIGPGDFEDDDGDGVADIGCGLPRGIDCDDFDPITAGGSVEACDGRDNDCDGAIDEGAMDTLWYFDADLDGHGSASNPTRPVLRACRPQPGYVASGGDCADDDPMRSPDAAETCNARDDDCDGSIDERNVCGCAPGLGDCNDDDVCETNTGSDRNNCGACGNVCTVGPNARGVQCVAGVCTSTGCRLGYEDCDGNAANGCETNVFVDTANCGACEEVCTAPAGTNVAAVECDGLECDIDACAPGFEDCDGDLANGCEQAVANDPNNCGQCGLTCGTDGTGSPIACRNGECAAPCIPGETGDCDGNPDNGCETSLSDASNCGMCGRVCGSGAGSVASCVSVPGVGYDCELACTDGFADCDANPANGCEQPVSFSGCGCAAPIPDCTDQFGPGSTGTCRGFGPGNASCQFAGCDFGAILCGVRCADTQVDPNNCGGCGITCGPGAICDAGTCSCGGGGTSCGIDGCVDTNSNPRHCGGCGIDCGPNACIGGLCNVPCGPDAAECDGNPATLCETPLRTTANCLACNDVCPDPGIATNHVSSSTCTASGCDVRCTGGFDDCDADRGNGCETSVGDDPVNCGSCGRSCGAGGRCALGGCDEVVHVATGLEHTCVLRSSGSVVCFGDNQNGQTGLPLGGFTDVATAPVTLPGEAIEVAVGDAHSCALVIDGGAPTVFCWGDNQFGQLGDGTTTDTEIPQRVTFPAGVEPRQLALGSLHSCAIGFDTMTSQSHGYCWGNNVFRQLGDGTVTNRTSPVRVGGGSPIEITALDAGNQHTCALLPTGGSIIDFACWGSNFAGQLGNGSTATTTTIYLGNITPATFPLTRLELSVGNSHTCILADRLYCWGANGQRQVDGSVATSITSPSVVPTPPSGSVQAVVAADSVTCVRMSDRRVECRGSNSFQVAPSAGLPTLSVWTRITELGNSVDDLFGDASGQHYAVRAGSRVFTWGLAPRGRLGIGPIGGGSAPPTQVVSLTP